jgi:hypothetical protein
LESRAVPALLALSAQASVPSDADAVGVMVPVELSGEFAQVEFDPRTGAATESDDAGPRQASYQVIDPARRSQPTGPVTLTDLGNGRYSYKFTLYLDARGAGSGRDGRLYYVLVTARDAEGSDGRTIPVQVSAAPAPGPGPRFNLTTSERAGRVDQHAIPRASLQAQAAAMQNLTGSFSNARRAFRRG